MNMNDSTLDLFTNHETDDRQHMVDTMAETYWDAMHNCANRGDNFDAIAIYEEWVVDSVDPQDGGYEFTFVPDLTDIIEDN